MLKARNPKKTENARTVTTLITIGNRTNGATANAAADAWPAVQTKYLHDHNPRAANAFQEH